MSLRKWKNEFTKRRFLYVIKAVALDNLYQFNYAAICKHCDAYHCKRCVWLNKKMTLEVNVPSREQCVIAHVERNASRCILHKNKDAFPNFEIKEIDYLDPFDNKDNWNE